MLGVFIWLFFSIMGHSRHLFIYFCLFNTVDSRQWTIKILPMTGFEPRTSVIGSNRSTNWATTTALFLNVDSIFKLHVQSRSDGFVSGQRNSERIWRWGKFEDVDTSANARRSVVERVIRHLWRDLEQERSDRSRLRRCQPRNEGSAHNHSGQWPKLLES